MSKPDVRGDKMKRSDEPSAQRTTPTPFINANDMVIVIVIAIATTIMAGLFDWFEMWSGFVQGHEAWELDELTIGMFALALGLIWYVWRRNVQIRAYVYRLESAHMAAGHLELTDPLTGLNNRKSFYALGKSIEHLSRRYAHRYCVLMIEVDEFTALRDAHGQVGGDAILKSMAQTIENLCRVSDIAGRLNQGRFGVILPETSRQNAKTIAHRLSKVVADTPLSVGKDSISISIRIGGAELNRDEQSLDDIWAEADAALDQAQRQGHDEPVVLL